MEKNWQESEEKNILFISEKNITAALFGLFKNWKGFNDKDFNNHEELI